MLLDILIVNLVD